MSENYPSSQLPLLPAEVVNARMEDPGFAEVLGRAKARARGRTYNPELHYPYRGALYAPVEPPKEPETADRRFAEIIDRWSRAARRPFGPESNRGR